MNTVTLDGVLYQAKTVRLGRRKHGFCGCVGCAAHGASKAALALCRRLPHCLRGRRADRRDVVWTIQPGA